MLIWACSINVKCIVCKAVAGVALEAVQPLLSKDARAKAVKDSLGWLPLRIAACYPRGLTGLATTLKLLNAFPRRRRTARDRLHSDMGSDKAACQTFFNLRDNFKAPYRLVNHWPRSLSHTGCASCSNVYGLCRSSGVSAVRESVFGSALFLQPPSSLNTNSTSHVRGRRMTFRTDYRNYRSAIKMSSGNQRPLERQVSCS